MDDVPFYPQVTDRVPHVVLVRRRQTVRLLVFAGLLGLAVLLWSMHRSAVVYRVQGWLERPSEPVSEGPLAGIDMVVAFPELHFDFPVFLCAAPDQPRHLFVAEQGGRIFRFENTPRVRRKDTFLDISDRVSRGGWEEGLLGLAFAPDFARSGLFYVYYCSTAGGPATGGRTVLSRFRLFDAEHADPDSEQVLLEVDQPYQNHNGGMIAFGPDGMLYLGLGDGGGGNDPHGHGQNRGTLLGSILRLDVSQPLPGEAYRIPPDNPFVGDPQARPEVWAYGLRDPWRFSFDPVTGELWVGDIGQERFEEVGRVPAGANCGWKAHQGFVPYDPAAPPGMQVHPPDAAYAQREGVSVTGGYVYRGRSVPALTGLYLYADFNSGAVWALSRQGPATPSGPPNQHPTGPGIEVVKLLHSRKHIKSFGEDGYGELYACAFDGWIYRFQQRRPRKP